MSPIIVGLLTVAAAIPVALATVVVAARRFSGTIRSSEAVTLWEAQEAFRSDLMDRNKQLRIRLDECEKFIHEMQERMDSLEEANAALRLENGELKAELARLREEVNTLLEENAKLTRANVALKKRVKELEDHNA